MTDNVSIDALIGMLTKLKNSEDNIDSNDNTSNEYSPVFSENAPPIVQNPVVEPQNNNDLMGSITNILNSLQSNQSQNNSTNTATPNNNLNDMLSGILGNIQNNSTNQATPQNNLNDMISGVLSNVQNGSSNSSNNADLSNTVSNVLNSLQSSSGDGSNPLASLLSQNGGNIMSMLGPMLQGANLNQLNTPKGNLLFAAKPFLSTSIGGQIDHGVRLINIAKTAKSAIGGLGGLSALTRL